MKQIGFIIVTVLSLISCHTYRSDPGNRDQTIDFSILTKQIVRAEHLLVIEEGAMSAEEKLLIATLQGLVSKYSSTQIYIHPGYGGYETWLRDLEARGVSLEYIDDPWSLVERFRDLLEGYILCSLGDQSINGANSLVSLYSAPAVDESLAHKMASMGIPMALDVRGRDERWLFDNYRDQLSKDVLFEQKEQLIPALRDFAVALDGFMFFDGNSTFKKEMTLWTNRDAPVFGWGDADRGEHVFVGRNSRSSLYTIPSDHARNLSVFSAYESSELKQKKNDATSVDENVHYISFLMSDGDNIQWMLGDLYSDARWWGSPKRGNFPMGWALSPMMADVAPTVLEVYYGEAASAEHSQHFVVGPSGSGYLYPSMYRPEDLLTHVERLNQYMGQLDTGIVEILDFNSLKKDYLWDNYTAQENIDALFYMEYSNYKAHKGKILWSNGKPIITPSEMLWDGLKGCDESSVIKSLNSRAKDPASPEGYSLVLVHAWSNGLDNIQNVIDGLDRDVKVVPPDELVRLISKNVIH